MSNWGIASTAPENEKIKAEFADFLNGMNSCGVIDYSTYCEIFDEAMKLFDKMYELGLKEQRINMIIQRSFT